jgi:hypothetical protein
VFILGWPRAVLHVSSSASVIGFAASLSDVAPQNGEGETLRVSQAQTSFAPAPDGASHLVTKGMLNATRRESFSNPQPLPPNEIAELKIELDCTAWRFAKGHRIRLSIANADWPNVWPTPELATSQVYRGPAYPSRLTLPVVPARGTAIPPEFLPSAYRPAPHASALHPNQWKLSYDVLTGRATSEVQVSAAFRANAATTIEREFASVCSVDPRDPAHASAHGWHVCRVARPNATTQGRADTVIQSTATHFHISLDLEVRVNDAVHFHKRWAKSAPRRLL